MVLNFGARHILLVLTACFITFCIHRALQLNNNIKYYLLYALQIFTKWKYWTNFNPRFEYANQIRIQILKPKFEMYISHLVGVDCGTPI